MDTAAPSASPYDWHDASPAEKDEYKDVRPPVTETPRAATVRRLAAGAVGVGLVTAAVLTLRGRARKMPQI